MTSTRPGTAQHTWCVPAVEEIAHDGFHFSPLLLQLQGGSGKKKEVPLGRASWSVLPSMERQDQGPGRGVSACACRGEPKRSVEWRKQNEGVQRSRLGCHGKACSLLNGFCLWNVCIGLGSHRKDQVRVCTHVCKTPARWPVREVTAANNSSLVGEEPQARPLPSNLVTLKVGGILRHRHHD